MSVNTSDEVHVVPRRDLIGHECTEDCVCGPTPQPVERDGGGIGWAQVHHSLDGREMPAAPDGQS